MADLVPGTITKEWRHLLSEVRAQKRLQCHTWVGWMDGWMDTKEQVKLWFSVF
jgi:hypothetical protein